MRRKQIRLVGFVSIALLLLALLLYTQMGITSTSSSTPIALATLISDADGSRLSPSLSFIRNDGQLDSSVRFQVTSAGHTVLFKRLSIEFRRSSFSDTGESGRNEVIVTFENALTGGILTGHGRLSGTANFYHGNNPAKWQTHVPTFEEIRYEGLYDGIDMVYTGASGTLKREFILAPGADPGVIRMIYDGVDAMYLRRDGVLVIETPLGRLTESAPVLYQEIGGESLSVTGAFKLLADRTLGFEVGTYDVDFPLVIDPDLTFASYLGGSGFDRISSMDTNAEGHFFVGGVTNSADFPLVNAHQAVLGGGFVDLFITRIDPATGTILYSTFFGGSDSDGLSRLQVDDADNVYIVGSTSSADFPTLNAVQAASNGDGEAIVAKFAPDGTLLFSTYLGGDARDSASDLDLDSDGNVWITGSSKSSDFPTTPDALNGSPLGDQDAFITKLSGDGSLVLYSTYLGGIGSDSGNGISVDAAGDLFVSGGSASTDFTGVPSGGGSAAFVVKLSNDGVNPPSIAGICTADGTGFDSASHLVVDEFYAYFGGSAGEGLPTTPGAHQPDFGGGGGDGMIGACKKATMEIAYLSYAGGPDFDFVTSLDLRPAGAGKGKIGPYRAEVYFAVLKSALDEVSEFWGMTFGTGNPLVDLFLLVTAINLIDSYANTEMAQVKADESEAHVVGGTQNTAIPITGMPIQSTLAGGFDGLITSYGLVLPPGGIIGFKFMDLDEDREFNNNDYVVEGIVFELLQNNLSIAQNTTDIFGTFGFSDLEPGNYQVLELIPPGFFLTVPDNALVDVIVESGKTTGPLVFGNGANLDYGDLPDPRDDLAGPCPIGGPLSCYRTVASVQGAAHVMHAQSIILGARIDADPDGQPTEFADGDDDNLSSIGGEDDEDGLISFTVLEGGIFQITVLVADASGIGGNLSVFIDLNEDGVLNDGSVPGGERERVISTAVDDGINILQSLPGTIQPGDVIKYIRLRIASQVVRFAWGLQLDGEVEDYHRSAIDTAFEFEGESDLPESYTLFQNYPNPFSESTSIRVELPIRENVSLTIHDVLGREVRILQDGVLPPGLREFVFDATGLTSGVYFYTLKTARYSKTNRMLLIR